MDASILPYLVSAVVTAVVVTVALMLRLQKGKPVDEATGPNPVEQQLAQLADMQSQLAGRLATLQEGQTTSQQTLNQALNERLDAVSQRLNQSLTENTQKTNQTLNERLEKVSKNLTETSLKNREQLGEQLGMLNTRLAVIGEAQKKLDSLTTEVVGLQEVLGNKQARGAFGEIQLNDLVTSALPPSAYSFQTPLSNKSRPDCLIKLPNPPGSIAVDSKFPLDSYRRLVDASDETAKLAATRQLRTDVQKHIKDISEKYIIPGETAESALMFLPSEAVYAELHARFADVVDQGYKARVWIVSPTTLMATLNTVRAVLKDAQMREQAHVIQAEVGKLLEDVSRLDARVDKLKGHFAQAEKDIRDIETSTAKITRKGERIKEVELEDPAELSPPSESTLQSSGKVAGSQPDLLAGE
ncbi:MAG: DNA recombination protein RmuC [Parvibaculaceae bacterium]|nr:DNA recombination protein RmuC [Parvibaculaceae bacterium]|tara:strand:+ start:216 stop:1457 length:1242 start_codon:yes stop_codon:yes gene_type:complete